ncbi:CG4553, partial [Drosophila busckii]
MSARLIFRSFYTTQWGLLARVPRRSNPGLGYQLEHLQQQRLDVSEDYADNEADFMSTHQTDQQYEAERQNQKDRVRQFMIKHKYFRDAKLPNLLLYAEKEQMRLLHERDAEEWSLERLAESFPATPDIVQKVLRAKWRPRSTKRILAHDANVMHNWAQLRAGDCAEVPPELWQHLQKFAQRERQDLEQLMPEKWAIRPELPVPRANEFRALLGNPANKQIALEPKQQDSLSLAPAENETFLLSKVKDKRKMRLQELKDSHLVQEHLEQPLPNPNGTGPLPSYVQKFERSEIVVSAEDQRKYEMSRVKERIVIPRKLYKAGATYRVEDAYYDDDGEFLYRVPGMTGNE